ncbi:MAG: sigma-54 dependent transcriptional regulator [Myxococcaceae bacterium]|nr:sigma-54 dependent transcriptional regulator [Myxococcaceae bacterium]
MSEGMTPAQPQPQKTSVLVVDDEPTLAKSLASLLTRGGFEAKVCSQPMEALVMASDPGLSVVLVDLNMPNLSGLEVLKHIKARHPDVEVIMMTGQGTVASALSAVRLGAWDYLLKPFESEEVVNVVKKAAERRALVLRNRELERQVASRPHPDFLGESQAMRDVFELIDRVSYSSTTVLVRGESGTGKELVARSLHRQGPRSGRPFIPVNCAAMTETLLESELFGHVKGAFTGAIGAKRGLFEAADGGTLFLDEIGDMPLTTQVHLLRALQEGEIRPVGSTDTVSVDVRVIAATNVDLKKAIEKGKFREDLYYRLNVISIAIPPLRERPTDVPVLAYHFLQRYARKLGREIERFAPDAMAALVANRWTGNVRELENVVERAAVLARGKEVTLADLPRELAAETGAGEDDLGALAGLPYAQAKQLAAGAFDRRYLTLLLKKTSNNITAAANRAGLDRSNFRRLLKQYQLIESRSSEVQDAGAEDGTGESPLPADDGERTH